jgi:hypothetical protein
MAGSVPTVWRVTAPATLDREAKARGWLAALRFTGAQRAAQAAHVHRSRLMTEARLDAEHLCMSLRGVQKAGARTVTSALHGLVRDDPRTREEFLSLTGGRP